MRLFIERINKYILDSSDFTNLPYDNTTTISQFNQGIAFILQQWYSSTEHLK